MSRYEIAMSSEATAATEAPMDLERFVCQQARWCRSFWRELFIQLVAGAVPNWWTWAELVYYGLFPVVLLATVIADDFHRSGTAAAALMLSCTVVPLMRIALVNWTFGYQQHSWWYGLYSFMFILVLLPIKFFALATMTHQGWETDRFSALTRKPLAVVYAWWLVLALGMVHYFR